MKIVSAGKQYSLIIDPFLKGVHTLASELIEEGSRVIDIACGNGSLALKLALRADEVSGIDISEEMISFAKEQSEKSGIINVKYHIHDATDLSNFKDQEFDFATISMALHQFPIKTAMTILKEMGRIAKNIIIIDYIFPIPNSPAGYIVRLIEKFAGKEHNQNFQRYLKFGGSWQLAEVSGLSTYSIAGKSVFTLIQCRAIEKKNYQISQGSLW